MGQDKRSGIGALTIAIALAFGTLSVPAQAAPTANLAEVLAAVAEDHPRITSARYLTRSGRADVSSARSALRPQIGIDSEIGFTGGSFALLPEARVSQLVYDGGRTPAELRRRKVRVELLGVQEQAVLAQLAAELAQAWISYYRATALLEISRQQVAALDELQELVVEIAAFDRGRFSDVTMVQSRLQQAVTTMQTREIAREDLADTIREIALIDVEPAGDVPDLAAYLPASAQECSRLAEAAPRVRVADLQVAEAAEAENGARNWWAPRVALEGARTSELDAQGDARLFNDFAVRLRVSALPFDSGGGRARLESARANVEASKADATLARTQLRDRAQRLWVLQARKAERLPDFADLVDRSDEARDIVFEQFRIGRRSILDVLAYDLERFNVRAQLANERFDIFQTQYELLGILGTIYPSVVNGAAGGVAAE